VPNLAAFFSNLASCRNKNDLTHGMHPYPAKFIPHIPRAVIAAYAPEGGTVWDPMCGSGTALVEAAVSGRPAVGTDLNPIAALVSRAKTLVLDDDARDALREAYETLAARERDARAGLPIPDAPMPDFHNRSHWFAEQVSRELADSRQFLCGIGDAGAQTVALCAFSASVVGVSNQESETRWRAKLRPSAPGEVYAKIAGRISDAEVQLALFAAAHPAPVSVLLADARKSEIASDSVDFVVTSPPYANSHDYYLYNKLRLFWLDYDVRPVQDAEIGSRNRHSDRKEGIDTYLDAMTTVLEETARVLRREGVACIVVADAVIRGVVYDMGALLTGVAKGLGLERLDHFSFSHTRFNATFQRGFGTAFEKSTHVLVFRNS
jgi:site-specific DNA-methyltransferase (cytosine-N4-specific)